MSLLLYFNRIHNIEIKYPTGNVDAQEASLKLQVDKDVSESIQEKFFPDDNTECE